jgi:hypothetical protein
MAEEREPKIDPAVRVVHPFQSQNPRGSWTEAGTIVFSFLLLLAGSQPQTSHRFQVVANRLTDHTLSLQIHFEVAPALSYIVSGKSTLPSPHVKGILLHGDGLTARSLPPTACRDRSVA